MKLKDGRKHGLIKILLVLYVFLDWLKNYIQLISVESCHFLEEICYTIFFYFRLFFGINGELWIYFFGYESWIEYLKLLIKKRSICDACVSSLQFFVNSRKIINNWDKFGFQLAVKNQDLCVYQFLISSFFMGNSI